MLWVWCSAQARFFRSPASQCREAILKVRKSCLELMQMRLHALQPGTTYTLDEMVERHGLHCLEVRGSV